MTIQELKTRIYSDFIASFQNAITPLKRSVFETIANTMAASFQLLYIYADRVLSESFITTCSDSRLLSYFAPLNGITRKDPTQSSGTIRFTGTNGAIVPSGTQLVYSGLEYETIANGTITLGVADIAAVSVGAGSQYNTLTNVDMFLSTPITGVDNKATSIAGFTGGIDQETIESVRTRTRQKNASPTSIDNDNYYKSLANEAPNVKAAFISDNKNGAGTFGVTILTYSNDGVPVADDLLAVQVRFNEEGAIPVYALPEFFIPTIVYQNFSILLSQNTTTKQTQIEQIIRDWLYLYQKPGTTLELVGLADLLRVNQARLVIPDPSGALSPSLTQVYDIGVISWT